MDYCKHFKNKKITVMGLHPEGRGVQDAAFLADCGALVTATDLRYEDELIEAIKRLKGYPNIEYVLGQHAKENFEHVDLVVRAASVPLGSEFLKHAKESGVEIETDETLFLKYAPKIKVVGVTGTRGKSTVTQLIYHILKKAGKRAHLAGNVRFLAALPLLKNVKEGDIVVLELSSWQLQQFGENNIALDIAVFTNFYADHMDYYKNDMQKYFGDKSQIFSHQSSSDVLITTKQAESAIERYSNVVPDNEIVIEPFETRNQILLGEHNKENAGCAAEVARKLGLTEEEIKEGVDSFEGVEGRLQMIRDLEGIKIYNDNNATSPEATIAALKAVEGKATLIVGGSDKGLKLHGLVDSMKYRTNKNILLAGTGTEILKKELDAEEVPYFEFESVTEAVNEALQHCEAGDSILFSPAFASFGMFKNEYDRNDQFVSIIKSL
jgi:UDP-N-acetylmuramoylalanine--D-glutamate ligase